MKVALAKDDAARFAAVFAAQWGCGLGLNDQATIEKCCHVTHTPVV